MGFLADHWDPGNGEIESTLAKLFKHAQQPGGQFENMVGLWMLLVQWWRGEWLGEVLQLLL